MKTTAEIISIGTELLLGHIVNTNAAYLSRKLASLGIDLYYQTTVGDNPSRLAESILRASGRADIIIMSGGLGPTVDDITIETLAKVTSKKLPQGAICLRNRAGTAPGLIIKYKYNLIIALPGPPRELAPMFEEAVIPYIKKRFRTNRVILSRLIRTTGLAESEVNTKVRDLLNMGPKTTVGIYASLGEVDLKITSKAKGERNASREISRLERVIRRRLKDYIFGCDDETLEEAVGKILTDRRETIAVAESCTGGLTSSRLTDVSGSSKYFVTGLVAYSNASKVNILGVRKETISRHGVVSPQVAKEMACGARLLSGADIGLGITGIAGPTGATSKKPVGLVYTALVTNTKTIVREFRFKGSRREIKFQASQAALDMIRKL